MPVGTTYKEVSIWSLKNDCVTFVYQKPYGMENAVGRVSNEIAVFPSCTGGKAGSIQSNEL